MKPKTSILIVDDEPGITESLSNILADEGYAVDTAENGEKALAVLQQRPYELVLLDVWLPGRKDGLQTLREIRKRNISAEVIMISGHASIDTAVRATKLGAFDFLEKPLSLEAVLESIQSALAQRRKEGGEKPVRTDYNYIANSDAMKEALGRIGSSADSGRPLLIAGEPGTGREYTARYIHWKSGRNSSHFIKVDCHSLKHSEFERLFGVLSEEPAEKGSKFSGLAGTVYLLEPQKLRKELRERLLELINLSADDKEGRLAFISTVNVGADQRSLKRKMEKLGGFYHEQPLMLPPLRNRGQDIPELIETFMESAAEDFGKPNIRLSRKAVERMLGYAWPGNVKELRTVVENMVMASSSELIEPEDIPFGGSLKAGRKISRGTKPGLHRKVKAAPSGSLRQKTIGRSVVITGLGLHSGIKTGLIISPLPPNSGIIFSDISSGKQISASLDNVQSTEYATSLRAGQTSVKTIEHIMATLHMYGVTNALLKVNEEIPILDGSAVKFCDLIENAGVEEQDGLVEPIVIDSKMVVGEIACDRRYIMIEPSNIFTVEYRMDYPQPVGKMSAKFRMNGIASFKKEIAPARTFGFVNDMKNSSTPGFAEGGKLSNVILVDDEKIVNTTLRFDDEFARHKILDVIGDFYLLGRPVIGKITANLSGHFMNIALLEKIRESGLKS